MRSSIFRVINPSPDHWLKSNRAANVACVALSCTRESSLAPNPGRMTRALQRATLLGAAKPQGNRSNSVSKNLITHRWRGMKNASRQSYNSSSDRYPRTSSTSVNNKQRLFTPLPPSRSCQSPRPQMLASCMRWKTWNAPKK